MTPRVLENTLSAHPHMVVEKLVELKNETGLHARPAMILAKLASSFRSDISVAREGQETDVDAKSILSLLTLGAERGTRLILRANGDDAETAIKALMALIASGFDL